MQGVCGCGKPIQLRIRHSDNSLEYNGLTCSACFELKCYKATQWCKPDNIHITATKFYPPNWAIPSDNGGWCNPPRNHFDLSLPVFLNISYNKADIVPVLYWRVPCVKQGGVKFEIKGNPFWMLILVYDVGKVGNVVDVKIKGTNTGWIPMVRNWGEEMEDVSAATRSKFVISGDF